MRKENQLSSTFGPEEYVAVRRSGAYTTVRSTKDEREYQRNVGDLKLID